MPRPLWVLQNDSTRDVNINKCHPIGWVFLPLPEGASQPMKQKASVSDWSPLWKVPPLAVPDPSQEMGPEHPSLPLLLPGLSTFQPLLL